MLCEIEFTLNYTADIHQPSHTPQDFQEIKLINRLVGVPLILDLHKEHANKHLQQIGTFNDL